MFRAAREPVLRLPLELIRNSTSFLICRSLGMADRTPLQFPAVMLPYIHHGFDDAIAIIS
jgi:hypothetical protein